MSPPEMKALFVTEFKIVNANITGDVIPYSYTQLLYIDDNIIKHS